MGWVSGLISQRTFRFWALAGVLVVSMAALAGGIAYGNTTSCTNTAATLTDSAFEIDPNANLIVNNAPCLDWLSGGAGTGLRQGVIKDNDDTSGATDRSFGNGTKEDTAVPSIVDGGIPPNKSDLKSFGVYTEQGQTSTTNPTGKYLALFWTRVQDPSGTTNMDFELNQSSTKSSNGVTPVRTNGDLLITYDLSNGGTVATISKRTWNNGSWSGVQPVSPAKGSINTSLIPSTEAGGLPPTGLGSLDPRTFGEAIIPFNALFGTNTCAKFGSAYLKSRSSDSFTAALKDFIAPAAVSISNCPAALATDATDSVTVGGSISDTATLDVPAATNGSITFRLYGPFTNASDITASSCTAAKLVSGAGSTKTVTNFNAASPNYTSDSYTTGTAGYYNWTAQFTSSTTGVNSTGEVGCGDTTEQSAVNPASPTLSTNATQSVSIGNPISDSATLSGATSNATGGITFKLYGPFDPSTSASGDTCVDSGTGANLVTTLGPNAIGSPNASGNYVVGSGNYTPTAVGRYQWVASYASGDGNNSNAASACRDANEASVVGKAPSKLNTSQSFYPNDSATLSADAGGTPSGSVDFSLFDNSSCSGTPLLSATNRPLSGGEASTNNTTVAVSTSGTYYWKVVYGGDGSHNGVTSCTENTAMTINNGGTVTGN